MPGRNLIKIYKANSYYHIYNRGVEKRVIFEVPQDYAKFLKFLYDGLVRTKTKLVCYCLMSNHYHLLLFQTKPSDITVFMRSLGTKYALYFNYKYGRVGHLFQGTYRARLIKNDQDLLNTSAYIHSNPRKGGSRIDLKKYEYSSFSEYMGIKTISLLDKKPILNQLNPAEYKRFVNNKIKEEIDLD